MIYLVICHGIWGVHFHQNTHNLNFRSDIHPTNSDKCISTYRKPQWPNYNKFHLRKRKNDKYLAIYFYNVFQCYLFCLIKIDVCCDIYTLHQSRALFIKYYCYTCASVTSAFWVVFLILFYHFQMSLLAICLCLLKNKIEYICRI